jgi:hypothetical protein
MDTVMIKTTAFDPLSEFRSITADSEAVGVVSEMYDIPIVEVSLIVEQYLTATDTILRGREDAHNKSEDEYENSPVSDLTVLHALSASYELYSEGYDAGFIASQISTSTPSNKAYKSVKKLITDDNMSMARKISEYWGGNIMLDKLNGNYISSWKEAVGKLVSDTDRKILHKEIGLVTTLCKFYDIHTRYGLYAEEYKSVPNHVHDNFISINVMPSTVSVQLMYLTSWIESNRQGTRTVNVFEVKFPDDDTSTPYFATHKTSFSEVYDVMFNKLMESTPIFTAECHLSLREHGDWKYVEINHIDKIG